ncbi:MAG: hypothetical protein JJE04_23625 [Acidobacteriia bacterium]|nr:hypothetical protein [Terriglobia bacterium]
MALCAHKCSVLLKTIVSVALITLPAASAAGLRIELVQGESAIHNISSPRAIEPVIRLVDDVGQPVAGGQVTFLTPEFGPGGRFASSGTVLTTTTDAQGLATARGLRPNRQTGQWEIRIAASHGGQKARAIMPQTNATPLEPVAAKRKSSMRWILTIAAGGAAAGLAAALGGGGSTVTAAGASPAPTVVPAATPTTIIAGAASLGRP